LSLRVLVIADRPEYRLLVRKHIEIEWSDAVVLEHRLGEDQPLDAKFVAAGYDAVIVVGAPPAESAEILASLLASRADFAPLVLVLLQDAPGVATAGGAAPSELPPDTPKLARLYGKKVDRERLVRAITVAARHRARAESDVRTHPEDVRVSWIQRVRRLDDLRVPHEWSEIEALSAEPEVVTYVSVEARTDERPRQRETSVPVYPQPGRAASP